MSVLFWCLQFEEASRFCFKSSRRVKCPTNTAQVTCSKPIRQSQTGAAVCGHCATMKQETTELAWSTKITLFHALILRFTLFLKQKYSWLAGYIYIFTHTHTYHMIMYLKLQTPMDFPAIAELRQACLLWAAPQVPWGANPIFILSSSWNELNIMPRRWGHTRL